MSMQAQAKNYINNLHQKLLIFDKASLKKVRLRNASDSHFIPISAAQGPISTAITAYETFLLQNNQQDENDTQERIMTPPLPSTSNGLDNGMRCPQSNTMVKMTDYCIRKYLQGTYHRIMLSSLPRKGNQQQIQ